jgi:hypothetical protein
MPEKQLNKKFSWRGASVVKQNLFKSSSPAGLCLQSEASKTNLYTQQAA